MRTFRIGVGVLARKIAAISAPGETIGVMLPNANGAAVDLHCPEAAGRVPAMLNFTSGPHNLVAACEEALVRLVLTSRAFVEQGQSRARDRGDRGACAHRLARGRARGRDDDG